MKLTSITIRNFRNIAYAEIPLTDAAIFIGGNEQGKSTLHNAIQLALHGHCEHTTRAGAGFADLIQTGKREAVITIDTDAGLRVTLTLTQKKRDFVVTDIATGEIRTDITSPAALWAALGINQTHAMVCMFPRQIVESTQFSSILSDYLRDGLTPMALADRVPAAHATYVAGLASRNRLSLESVAGYEALGAAAYERRTVLNRDLKLADATIKEIGFLKPVRDAHGRVWTAQEIPDLTARLSDITARLDVLHRQQGAAAQAGPPVALPALEPLDAELAQARAEFEALRAAHVAALELEREYLAAEADMTSANDAQAAAVTAVQAAKEIAPICAGCGRKHTKASSEYASRETAAEAGLALIAAEEWQETALARINPLRPLYSPGAIAAAAAAANAAHDVMNRAYDTVVAARAQHAAARPAYDGPPLAEVEAAIAAAQGHRVETQSLIHALEQHRVLAEVTAHRDALQSELAQVTFVIREFHDGAAYRELLAAAAAGIVERVNAWLPEPLEIVADGKSFALIYAGRALSLASVGRRAMVAYAFASAFADCGAPVLLDDINNLDPTNRGALCMRLREATAGTVLLAATPLSARPEYLPGVAAALAPMAVWAVEDGEMRRVLVAGEAAA